MLELGLRLVVSLGIVLGLFWFVARAGSRRMGGASRSATLKVRGRQSLGRTSSVAVVEVGSRVLVVGVGEGGVRLLTELDPDELEDPAVTETDDDRPTGPPQSGSPLGGSLLAPQTWKQAWTAATKKTGIGTAARAAVSEPAND